MAQKASPAKGARKTIRRTVIPYHSLSMRWTNLQKHLQIFNVIITASNSECSILASRAHVSPCKSVTCSEPHPVLVTSHDVRHDMFAQCLAQCPAWSRPWRVEQVNDGHLRSLVPWYPYMIHPYVICHMSSWHVSRVWSYLNNLKHTCAILCTLKLA